MAIPFPDEGGFAPQKPDLENIESFDNAQVGGIEKFDSIDSGLISISDVVAKSGDTMSGELVFSAAGIKIAAGHFIASRAAVTDYSTVDEVIVGVTSTASARTIDLTSSDCVVGRIIIVKDESGAANVNNITVTTQGAETIDGAATYVINTAYGTVRLYSNGTNWFTW